MGRQGGYCWRCRFGVFGGCRRVVCGYVGDVVGDYVGVQGGTWGGCWGNGCGRDWATGAPIPGAPHVEGELVVEKIEMGWGR